MFRLTDTPIAAAEVRAVVEDPGFGAILVFEGVARNHFEGRPVVGLAYEAYPEMAEAELARLAIVAAERWGAVKVAVLHRTGAVPPPEASVAVGVACPHRAEAFEAARWLIDTLKESVPIWKTEHADRDA